MIRNGKTFWLVKSGNSYLCGRKYPSFEESFSRARMFQRKGDAKLAMNYFGNRGRTKGPDTVEYVEYFVVEGNTSG